MDTWILAYIAYYHGHMPYGYLHIAYYHGHMHHPYMYVDQRNNEPPAEVRRCPSRGEAGIEL